MLAQQRLDCFKPVGLIVSSPGRSRFGKPWDHGSIFIEPRMGRPWPRAPHTGLENNDVAFPGLARRLAAPWATNERPIRG